jgi:hypothetical protein
MTRVEIIANHSVEENILDAFKDEGVGKFYTKFSGVYGVGSSGPRMGDAIWPEENFSMVIWCEEDEAHGLERAIKKVKNIFPDEGIKIFRLREPILDQAVLAGLAAAQPSPTVLASPVPTPPAPLAAPSAPIVPPPGIGSAFPPTPGASLASPAVPAAQSPAVHSAAAPTASPPAVPPSFGGENF